jgi:hypothetical protein
MPSLPAAMSAYRAALREGHIQVAYLGLMQFMSALRTRFEKNHPELTVPGTLYFGYMDMTYFAVVPRSLAVHKLKIAIVFVHETFRFEVWLSGVNRPVQETWWKRIQESGWNKYRLVSNIKGSDSILEHVLAENPDFSDLDALAQTIERGTLTFIADMEALLARITG